MPFKFHIPGRPVKNVDKPRKPFKAPTMPTSPEPKKEPEPEQTVRFDNIQEVNTAFKKGAIPWPKFIEVGGFLFSFNRSHKKGITEILKGSKPGYVIYTMPKENVEEAKKQNLGHLMVFLFRAKDASNMYPHGIGFTTKARGAALYEEKEVIGDVVLLKIALPSGIINLKGKVDTGAEISSLHVDSKPQMVGDTVRFQNHNASGNIITAPLVARQAVKSADGGVEYRPVIELDIEVNGKGIRKAQFNLNDRSHMEHEVLIGQNILEKGGFLVNPSQDRVQEDEEDDLDLENLTEEQIDEIVLELDRLIEESSEEETEED